MDLVTLQGLLDNISFAVLFITMLLYWSSLAFDRANWLKVLGTTGMAVANLCIAALLVARWIEGGYFPLSNLYESLFFIAWGITAIHFVAERMSNSLWVGAMTAPAAMGITAFATLTLPGNMQVSEPLVPALKSNWLMMHVSVMLLSYSALMVGSLVAIAFLVITRGQAVELKGSSVGTGGFRDRKYTLKRSVGETSEPVLSSASGGTAVLEKPAKAALSMQRLTLADTLDNISYRIIGLGFPLLTI
ncbi:MAG: cytochrome c biogenesis protein CcsA, partial [Cyanobacteria bacterium P01_F01_bin.116]